MSTIAVAKKEFNDAVRSKVLIGLTGLFILFAGGTALIYAQYIVEHVATELNTTGLIITLYAGIESFLLPSLGLSPVHVFLPFVGLLLGYRSIVNERESGQIKLLLSLPHSRIDVVVGKLVGRAGVGIVAAGAGFLVAIIVGIVMYQDFLPTEFAGFVVATIAFLFVYVSIGISISSASPSTPFAIAGAAVYMVVFHGLWGAAFLLGRIVLELPFEGPYSGPNWFLFLRELNPARAYNHLVTLFVPNLQSAVPESAPFYLQDWFYIFVMVFWIVVPLGIGYAIFEHSDL